MSDVAAVALITGGVGLFSLLLTLWFNARSRQHDLEQRGAERHEDYREWYRRTLFERRLEAIQEGGRHLSKLWNAMYHPYLEGGKIPIGEAVEWYERNILYLHGEMPDKSPVGRFLYGTEWRLMEGDEVPDEAQWAKANDFLKREADDLLEELNA